MNQAPVITISATFGAGGSVIAPAVAARLHLPFLDRMVSADLAAAAKRSSESLSEAESRATPHNRFFAYLAHAAPIGTAVAPPVDATDDDQTLRCRAESGIADLRRGQGGVVLGRAAAVVLAGAPATYHVRLDGPRPRRVASAAAIEHIELGDAERRQDITDRARTAYVRRLYHTDPTDPALYHLIIDSTVFPAEVTVDLVVRAAVAAGVVA